MLNCFLLLFFLIMILSKIEVSVDSKSMTSDRMISAWDAILQKYSVRERFSKLGRILYFVLALEISFGLLLASIIIAKDDAALLRLGIFASILLAIYSCKKLYPKI